MAVYNKCKCNQSNPQLFVISVARTMVDVRRTLVINARTHAGTAITVPTSIRKSCGCRGRRVLSVSGGTSNESHGVLTKCTGQVWGDIRLEEICCKRRHRRSLMDSEHGTLWSNWMIDSCPFLLRAVQASQSRKTPAFQGSRTSSSSIYPAVRATRTAAQGGWEGQPTSASPDAVWLKLSCQGIPIYKCQLRFPGLARLLLAPNSGHYP